MSVPPEDLAASSVMDVIGDPVVLPGSGAPSAADSVLAGGGEMGALMRSFDWAGHSLGPVETWSASQRTIVQMLLANRFPQLLWWGPDYICLYNDAYRPVLGSKHPGALGVPVRHVWSEIWHVLKPLIDTPFEGGPSTWIEDFALELNRKGYFEEAHFTVAYSPVPDEAAERGIGGVLATVVEITEKIIGERRLAVLSDLGRRSLVEAQTAEAACRASAEAIGRHPLDVPFALLYLIDPDSRRPHLVSTAGFGEGEAPPGVEWDRASGAIRRAIDEALRLNAPRVIEGVGSVFEAMPRGPWSDPPSSAVAIPIQSSLQMQHAGVLVAGVSSRLALDERYLAFLDLVAGQIAVAVSNARAYEAERRRAEELAELDRAKTAFFSNVSHEFRTPLTLMLGPIEEALRLVGEDAPMRQELTVAHRNALRLLKLVNTLLEFSRIEAGRVEAVYERADLAALTADLASGFRSAIERAGLRLVLELPPEPLHAFVDRDMWEKILLNLISNAFKHTFEGHVRVVVRELDDAALVEVHDTGIGIPADQLPFVFERFHRVPNARSRAHEGTGIGLALVQELVGLHGGTVRVSSEDGVGSTFAVRVPLGAAHLPPDRIGAIRTRPSTTLGAAPYVEEALRWLPASDDGATPLVKEGAVGGGGRIVLADDNADMREYVTRLLTAQGWAVETVPDGLRALEAVRREPPDLLLSDVMMPGLDGFELLRRLRADANTSGIPVILLSARAAEEAKVEGMERGADDYLVKPFSANELIARVGAHLRLGESRRRTLASERLARERAEHAAAAADEANRVKSDFLAVMSHELRTPLNAIGGYAQLMEMEIHGPLTERQRNDLVRINESQRHLLGLINGVLNYAKLDAGVETYEIEDVPMRAVLEACRTMTAQLMKARGLDLRLEGCAAGVVVRADREKTQQVVLNLLSNAAKFTDAGGIVTVSCQVRGSRVLVSVTDTGCGIAPQQAERIFQPFVQLDRDRTRIKEGTGLGLAISRELALGMGGELSVESELGRGSTFTLVLPRADS